MDRKSKHLPEARALYAEGLSMAAIAEALPVSVSTVRRWAREEAAGGRPWTRRATPESRPEVRQDTTAPHRRVSPRRPLAERLRRRLERRLEKLVRQHANDVSTTALEDHMLKTCKVLELLKDHDDPGTQLEAMRRFAAFCVRTLSEDEMGPVRKAIRLFLDEVRKGCE